MPPCRVPQRGGRRSPRESILRDLSIQPCSVSEHVPVTGALQWPLCMWPLGAQAPEVGTPPGAGAELPRRAGSSREDQQCLLMPMRVESQAAPEEMLTESTLNQ